MFLIAIEDAVPGSERPGNHEWELACPKRVAVLANPLCDYDVRAGITQSTCPPRRVLKEERFECAGREVGARQRARHHGGWQVAGAWRGGEDRTVDVWMPKTHGEGEFPACRHSADCGAFGGQGNAETRAHPLADVIDDESLVRGESLLVGGLSPFHDATHQPEP